MVLRMFDEYGSVVELADPPSRLILAHLDLPGDHPAFSLHLSRIENAVQHPVGDQIDGRLQVLFRGGDVIGGVIAGGVGVGGPTQDVQKLI
jgi:hypothetical protein